MIDLKGATHVDWLLVLDWPRVVFLPRVPKQYFEALLDAIHLPHAKGQRRQDSEGEVD